MKTASKDFRVDVLICHLAGHQTRHTVDVLSVNEKERFLHSYLNQHGRLCSQLVACRCAGIAMRLGSGRNWVGWGCVKTGQRQSRSEDTTLVIWGHPKFCITLGRTYGRTYRIFQRVAYQVTESDKTCGLQR